MSAYRTIKDIFNSMIKDGKIIFLIIASILIAFSSVAPYLADFTYNDILLEGIFSVTPFAFAWLVIGWTITDKSLLRKPYPYLAIFSAWFIYEIYWYLFNFLFPITYTKSLTSEDIALGKSMSKVPTREWLNLQETAFNFYIILFFVIAVFIFVLFWYLTNPKNFPKNKFDIFKKKNFLYAILGAILITMPHWITRSLYYIFGIRLFEFFITNNLALEWYYFIINAIPVSIAFLIFGIIITNIKMQKKYVLYSLIIVYTAVSFIPIYTITGLDINTDLFIFFRFLKYLISYFFVFLGFILLSKEKYLE